MVLPIIGYDERGELATDRDRKKFGLPPKERMRARDDPQGLASNYIGHDADWIAFKARRASWNLLHELAGAGDVEFDAADVAASWDEYERLRELELARRKFHTEYVTVKITAKDVSGKTYEREVPFQ